MGVDVYEQGDLDDHPGYRWVFTERVWPAIAAMSDSPTAHGAAARLLPGVKDARFLIGKLILDGALATAGLPDSRRILLVGGVLAPPCIRFADGTACSLINVHREATRRSLNDLQEVELLSNLASILERPGIDEAEKRITDMCTDLHARWECFEQCERLARDPRIPTKDVLEVDIQDQNALRAALAIANDRLRTSGENPNPSVYLDVAILHAYLREFSQAIAVLEQAMQRWPGNSRLRRNYQAIKRDAGA